MDGAYFGPEIAVLNTAQMEQAGQETFGEILVIQMNLLLLEQDKQNGVLI